MVAALLACGRLRARLAFHEDRAYAAVEVDGLLRWDDRGRSWRLAGGSSGQPSFGKVPARQLHPMRANQWIVTPRPRRSCLEDEAMIGHGPGKRFSIEAEPEARGIRQGDSAVPHGVGRSVESGNGRLIPFHSTKVKPRMAPAR